MKTRTAAALISSLALTAAAAPASAAVLLSISTTQGANGTTAGGAPAEGYDPTTVTITAAPNIAPLTPADLSSPGADGTGIVGLTRFANNAANATANGRGFFSLDSSANRLDNLTDFTTGYFAFTVAATNGATLNLDTLNFNSAVFTANNRRGFEVYAELTGGTFDSTDLLVNVDDENTVRPAAVAPRVGDLSAAKFQGATSVEFRVFPTTDAIGRTIDLQEFVVNGTVVAAAVPEPTSLAAAAVGLAALGGRRRR